MNILITGGAGFIASHLTDALLEEGHRVAVLDNFSTGKRENVNPKAEVYEMDILDEGLSRVFESFRPEVVYHHAAQIDVQTSLKQPMFDAKVNILGTIHLLEQCVKHGARKIIYASSAAAYGTPEYLGVDERHSVKPLSFYGISKHTPEHYIEAFSRLHGLDYTILRYANVYGIRQDPKGEGGVVSIFLDKLLSGEQPLIYGDGEQTRDFIYVRDLVTANRQALTRGSGGLFNISRNEQTSVNELLQLMGGILGTQAEPSYREAREGDIVHSRLDNTRALEALEWTPRYTLSEGLEETCAYYRLAYRKEREKSPV
ncbi:NAD-dependent epimerase/dehydratase family protein [Paenibacillus aurantius]|uniref:NAD-dependent epimerase/dehydratase family protein n=1 Tax=Paenibacillus aurantius TaxID=2918900 RepID=A0AA96RHB8_9BACL|nr:NAD-dependent epimerase/dehydratase family protein [Paenibacillus aurantius]WNQ10949.1 NAD-dependent epimerase/dehydratase family protein [Paenibacillus aurantius]